MGVLDIRKATEGVHLPPPKLDFDEWKKAISELEQQCQQQLCSYAVLVLLMQALVRPISSGDQHWNGIIVRSEMKIMMLTV